MLGYSVGISGNELGDVSGAEIIKLLCNCFEIMNENKSSRKKQPIFAHFSVNQGIHSTYFVINVVG